MSIDEDIQSPRLGGRPTREESEQLGERIIEAATELFLTEGYGETSIEAVADRARISKRTFYHRFPDKAALFRAVVHRLIESFRPPAGVPLFEGTDLETVLRRVAPHILSAALTPNLIALHRLLVAEAQRFPELAAGLAGQGGAEVVREITRIVERENAAGRMKVAKPEFAATAFIELIIARPLRQALGIGLPMTDEERDRWADDAVTLFLHGCQIHTQPASWSDPSKRAHLA